MEEKEYNGWEGADHRHHLDNALLCLADGILLRLIAVTTVGAAAAAAAGSPVIATTSMPAIDVGALFIGREEREGNNGSGVTTEDDDDADAKVVEYARDYLEVAQPTLGGAFWEEDHNSQDDGDQ
jgi:hypothetical protein